MNKAGKQRMEKVNKDWKELLNSVDNKERKRLEGKVSDSSAIQEATMRSGIEVRAYEAYPSDYENIAITILKEGIVKAPF